MLGLDGELQIGAKVQEVLTGPRVISKSKPPPSGANYLSLPLSLTHTHEDVAESVQAERDQAPTFIAC